MHPEFNKNLFLVKEHKGIFKAANNYDIYDPETGKIILECREDSLGTMTKIFRFTKYKRHTPFDVKINSVGQKQLLRVTRGVSIIHSIVNVLDDANQLIGTFDKKFFSIGGSFDVMDKNKNIICSLKGKWSGWDFRFMKGETELATINKKWAGLGQELFTSADNYMLKISDQIPANDPIRSLIIASVVCIDMVLKE